MKSVLLGLKDVRMRVPRSRSTIYAEIAKNLFPPPIKLGRGSYWREDEVERLIDAYSAGANPGELMALCDSIHERRKTARHSI